ncbi:hypothetical protein B2J93_6433 [Marssonina coronariae]|uniref:Uncharacterized protein n=1 Tax=Diplocarpon coronariae TaxID=2795749 RepID=A0A218Z4S7_9HELO|nr:hypothetical protein B2J93_6433 [Marssonina coronariae]
MSSYHSPTKHVNTDQVPTTSARMRHDATIITLILSLLVLIMSILDGILRTVCDPAGEGRLKQASMESTGSSKQPVYSHFFDHRQAGPITESASRGHRMTEII